MAGVFQNIGPHPPHPPPLVRVEDTLARKRGVWRVNILEDVRHSSVLYVCKYFVLARDAILYGQLSLHCKKLICEIPVHRRDVTNQTLPGRELFST
jgi:hypothetical protein